MKAVKTHVTTDVELAARGYQVMELPTGQGLVIKQ
jgi:hypothetical protein